MLFNGTLVRRDIRDRMEVYNTEFHHRQRHGVPTLDQRLHASVYFLYILILICLY